MGLMLTVSQPAVNSDLSFVHRGRKYTLQARPGQANFYLRLSIQGRRTWKSLDTPLKPVAIKNAKILLDAILMRDWGRVEELRMKSPYCSLAQIVERYERDAAGILGIDPGTVRLNARSLTQVVREGLNVDSLGERRADALSADLIRNFVRVGRVAKRTDHTIASRLNCARSVVSRRSIDNVLRGLKLPDFGEFRTYDPVLSGAADLGFRPFAQSVEADLEAMAERARVDEPGVWLAYVAMARLGMRNSEVRAMRWSWFVELPDGLVVLEIRNRLEEAYRTKTGEARAIGVPVDLWAMMLAARGEAKRVFYLPGETMTDRRRLVERRLNAVIRPLLPGYRKGAYELRRWAGSRVWTESGPAAAQRFLGHASIATTERYYATYLQPVSALSAPVQAVVPGPR